MSNFCSWVIIIIIIIGLNAKYYIGFQLVQYGTNRFLLVVRFWFSLATQIGGICLSRTPKGWFRIGNVRLVFENLVSWLYAFMSRKSFAKNIGGDNPFTAIVYFVFLWVRFYVCIDYVVRYTYRHS